MAGCCHTEPLVYMDERAYILADILHGSYGDAVVDHRCQIRAFRSGPVPAGVQVEEEGTVFLLLRSVGIRVEGVRGNRTVPTDPLTRFGVATWKIHVPYLALGERAVNEFLKDGS